MSELKAISGHEIREYVDYNTSGIDPEDKEWRNYGKELSDTLYYHKPEADKVIAEKDKEIAELKEQVQEERSAKVNYKISANDLSDGLKDAYEELKHHKYKRCLKTAMWCFTKSNYHFVLARHGEDTKENIRRSILYSKWRNRWLGLAEKFKEVK